MALKEYVWRGGTWQFEEGRQPADAVEVVAKAAAVPAKAAPRPRNKARTPRTKEQ